VYDVQVAVQNVNRPRVLGKRHVDLSEVLSRHTNLKSVRTGCGPTCPLFRLCPDHGEKISWGWKVLGNALVRRAHLLANDRGANVFDESPETSGRALSLLLLPISRKTS